ncbi:RHS repeat-associated core domain-containing protein [Brevibacillus sedimenti]|uniref:RHS repeat-associated core domain-containing protein n=1 Tax=Brevibacillus sedimenti TaxID=2613334 RepID=UPI00396487C9
MSNPFKYSGEIFDEKKGYYYLRARYYDPKIGRFISEDTYKGQVDNPLSLNRYTYVHNNPLRFVDPSGHWNQAIGANWVINEAKNKWTLAQTEGEKRYWQNYANDIRAKMIKAGYSQSDIMQSTDAMIPDSEVMKMARESAPGLTLIADFNKALWDYPGEAAAVKGAFFVGSLFNKGKGFSKLEEGLNFTGTAAKHMNEAGRFIPVQIQQSVIKYGKGFPDPRGTNATMYYDVMYKNGKKYNVEVLYDAETNTVFHFKYTDREIRNGNFVLPATK